MIRRAQAVLAVTARAYGLPLLERSSLAVRDVEDAGREPSTDRQPPPRKAAHERALETAG